MPKHPPTGVEMIAAERLRQITTGVVCETDDHAAMALGYLTARLSLRNTDDRKDYLIRAGAMIAAALDRLEEEKR